MIFKSKLESIDFRKYFAKKLLNCAFSWTAIKLDLAEEQKKRLEDENKNNKEYKEELKKKVDDAEKDYQKALKDMPGGWSLLLTQAIAKYADIFEFPQLLTLFIFQYLPHFAFYTSQTHFMYFSQ